MTFLSTIINKLLAGTRYMTVGTFQNTEGSTGGDIDTGLRVCHNIFLQYTGASTIANNPALNVALPCDGKAVTIVTDANADGIFVAIGEGI